MTRTLVPLSTPDVSTFAKLLKRSLDERHAAAKPPPSHLELLNLIARAAGLRNFSTLKATATAEPVAAQAELSPAARKTLQQFDEQGRLVRLHAKLSVQQMAVWALWTHFAARRNYTEKEVNALLNAHHTFGDPASLRREMVEMRLLGRLSDCSRYWKEPKRPTAEVQAFLKAWRAALR
ncbi:MAG: DUF2087 domain-containing protein [Burkholderiales bacterium]|nr:DUF2087 domain-containing protein [Burkholderiales bacterium]